MPAEVTKTPVPESITTPSTVEAGIGALEFTDGYPTSDTAERLRDHLDYVHGVETFMNTVQGVSTYAIRQGFLEAGVMDGDVLLFSGLMDSRSLFLTGNADTVYFWFFLDLTQGPQVVEFPTETLPRGVPTSGTPAPTTSWRSGAPSSTRTPATTRNRPSLASPSS